MVKMVLKNNKEGTEKQEEMYVMILQLSNEQYYVDVTTDIKKRIKEHEAGRYNDTAKLLPVKLRFFVSMIGLQKARKLASRIRKVGATFWFNGLLDYPLKYDYDI